MPPNVNTSFIPFPSGDDNYSTTDFYTSENYCYDSDSSAYISDDSDIEFESESEEFSPSEVSSLERKPLTLTEIGLRTKVTQTQPKASKSPSDRRGGLGLEIVRVQSPSQSSTSSLTSSSILSPISSATSTCSSSISCLLVNPEPNHKAALAPNTNYISKYTSIARLNPKYISKYSSNLAQDQSQAKTQNPTPARAQRTRTHSELLEIAARAQQVIEDEYSRDPCWNRRPRFFSFANDGRNIDEKTRHERRIKLTRYRTCKRYWAHLIRDASYTGVGKAGNAGICNTDIIGAVNTEKTTAGTGAEVGVGVGDGMRVGCGAGNAN